MIERDDEFELERFRNNLNGALTMTTYTCSYSSSVEAPNSIPPERNVSGCSEIPLEHLVQNHDLDTIINPHIIKNLIDPSLASSSTSSTPIHAPHQPTSIESQASSSFSSGSTAEKIKTIECALQKTTISDSQSTLNSTEMNETVIERQAPEGETMVIGDK